jgi:hypothetical protein
MVSPYITPPILQKLQCAATSHEGGPLAPPFVLLPVPLPTPFDWPVLSTYLCSVCDVLLIAGALGGLILLMKAGFDRAEARAKKLDGKKGSIQQ